MHVVHRKIDIFQYLAGGMTLADEHVEQRGKLRGFVNTFSQTDEQHFRSAYRVGASGRRLVRLFRFVQLNLPFEL